MQRQEEGKTMLGVLQTSREAISLCHTSEGEKPVLPGEHGRLFRV